MIFGIGVDITTISRIAKVYERFGDRFAQRILAADEHAQLNTQPNPGRFLAKRFAIKEAAVKALGTGEREGVLLKDFAVHHNDLGKPHLRVSGGAALRYKKLGISTQHVSLSDEGDQVVAFVVLECNNTQESL